MNTKKTDALIKKNDEDLEKINQQRRAWLYASSIVLAGIVALIFSWDWLDNVHSKSVWWVIISLMLILSVNWWYWTMRVVLRLINHQKIEFQIIHELLYDIKDLKTEIRQMSTRNVDKSK